MRTLESRAAFEDLLRRSSKDVTALNAASAVDGVLNFYRDVRASDVTLEADGDMLLYQWGVYDSGQGPAFEFDLTRQFAVDWELDDDALFQLSLTLRFEAAVGASLESGHEWCLHPDDVGALRTFIADSAAFRAVADLQPLSVTLAFGGAG